MTAAESRGWETRATTWGHVKTLTWPQKVKTTTTINNSDINIIELIISKLLV